MTKGSQTSTNTKTQKEKQSSSNSVDKSKKKSKNTSSGVKKNNLSKNDIEKSQKISKNNNPELVVPLEKETHDKKKIELKPCKGSITRILMDEGFEGYTKFMKERSKIFKEKQAKWREERMNEFCGLNERESDKIPYNVYEHILYHITPWRTFEEFLTEDEDTRIEKMKYQGFIVDKPTEETIYLPLSNEYITRKIYYDEDGERLEYNPSIEQNFYNEEGGYSEDEYSEYEWEEEYDNYESSGDEYSDDDDFY